MNLFYNSECIKGMERLADESVDLIVCDLPYGLTGEDWDVPLDMAKLWKQYRRILKGNGTILLFGMEPFSSMVRMSAPDLYKYDWIWRKSRKTAYAQSKGMPLNEIENIMVFTKGEVASSKNRVTYNPQGTRNVMIPKHDNGFVKYVEKTTDMPTNILEYGSVLLRSKFHPCQKPLDLLKYLIKTHSNEGDTVLDNCAGSGSTLIAARDTNRIYIGYERYTTFFNIAMKRLEFSGIMQKPKRVQKKERQKRGPNKKFLLQLPTKETAA